jgi:hypothetical protein
MYEYRHLSPQFLAFLFYIICRYFLTTHEHYYVLLVGITPSPESGLSRLTPFFPRMGCRVGIEPPYSSLGKIIFYPRHSLIITIIIIAIFATMLGPLKKYRLFF